MADSDHEDRHREIFVVRHHRGDHEAHHGGAWKIAFADFMTAMMALFLVLWLISSTSEKTRHTVAQYFNPVKLVDMSTLKKGFRDPKQTEMGSGPSPKESQSESETSKPNPPPARAQEVNPHADGKTQASREAALFRDPYAVLAEIAASASARAPKPAPSAETRATLDDLTGRFTDPFATVPREARRPIENVLPLAQDGNAGLQGLTDEGKQPDLGDKAALSQAQAPEPNAHLQKSPRAE
jgi:chemotaxis protein MotB